MKKKTVKLRVIFALIVFSSIFLSFISLSVVFNVVNVDYYAATGAPGIRNSFGFRLLLLVVCFLIGAVIERFVNKKIFQPINSLNQSMKEVAKGNFNLTLNNKSNVAEVREMMAHFNTMAEELGSIEVFRNDFVNSVSHEFKTPLTAIEGYATLLQSEDLTEKERHIYTSYIINNTKRLTNLSTNILKLSRLENQELLLEKNTFNLAEQIRTAILTLEREWGDKKMTLAIELEEIDYNGNQDLLFQVWLNLIYNAIKFTPSKGLIKVSLKEENEKILFQVIDNGIGISLDARKRIFEKFYQSDKSHNSEGSGLGLPLVRRIVNLHEGIIHVESELNIGSTFTVTFAENRNT